PTLGRNHADHRNSGARPQLSSSRARRDERASADLPLLRERHETGEGPERLRALCLSGNHPVDGRIIAPRQHTPARRSHGFAQEAKGTWTVYRIADGRRILRLEQFETSNGPDVHVYLVAAADVQQDATVKTAGFVDLGSIKGNRGDQNYDVPADVDLAKYRAA